MKVGITYDRREDYLVQGLSEEETAEFDRNDTIQIIEQTLQDLGYETDLIGNIQKLTIRIAQGDRWDLVFNIAEGLRGFGREAQVPALLDAYAIPYTFSDPLVLSLTLHKAMTKHVIRDQGIPTPDFFLVENDGDPYKVNLPFPLFAKPVAEGTGKGINTSSKIENISDLKAACKKLIAKYNQPVLIETFLPGREFTVGIIGTGKEARAIGVLEINLRENAEPTVYSYLNKELCEDLVDYLLLNDPMANKAKEIALKAWQVLGCRDAGRVDLRSDADGQPNFIEVNPLAGLHPEHSDLPILCKKIGITYHQLLGMVMESAIKRAKTHTTLNPRSLKNSTVYKDAEEHFILGVNIH